MDSFIWIVVGAVAFLLLNCLWVWLFVTVETRRMSASEVQPVEEKTVYLRLVWGNLAHPRPPVT